MAEHLDVDFAVVIVNYGSPQLLAENIDPALDASPLSSVVVVDNFHSTDSREATAQLCRDRGWLLVPSSNVGFGAGVNKGVEAAMAQGHEQFILLNPDATATSTVLGKLASHVRDHPEELVSPFMDTSDGRPHFRGTQVSLATGQMRSSWSPGDQDPKWKNWLSGACLAFGAEAFERIGGFSEQYFLYWEDVDFSRLAATRGLRLELRDDLRVVHDEGGTHTERGSRAKSPLYYYYNVRGRLLFGRRHLQGRDLGRWVLATPRQSYLIWLRGGRRQLVTAPRGAWAALRGMVSGLVLLAGRPPRDVLTPVPREEVGQR